MISDISLQREQTHLVPLIFLDTLYHFQETLDLAKEASERYLAEMFVFKPAREDGTEFEDAKAFERENGEKLWEKDGGEEYDYLVKVSRRTVLGSAAEVVAGFMI
jgi:phosphoadenosine phosphosulfate reductase